MRILIVEDDAPLARSIAALLRPAGHAIDHVATGADALMVAGDGLDDRVRGLDLGADDYLRKPFAPEELEARVRALGRRRGGDPMPQIVVGTLTVDRSQGEARVDGQVLDLRRREWAVLEALASRAGQIVPRDTLLAEVFGFDEPVGGNALEVNITRLRAKLPQGGPAIRTVRGLGYLLDAG